MKTLVQRVYWRVRDALPPNRIVVALMAPLAALAGSITVWVAEHFPGVSLDEGSLTAFFIAGAGAAVVAVYKWLDGWAKYEADYRRSFIDHDVGRAPLTEQTNKALKAFGVDPLNKAE